jgi:hypothetical protein
MKTIITSLLVFIIAITNTFAQDTTPKEIVIVGTMHQVPKIVKHSYKPMLKYAKKYNPQAIYVESPMPNDTLSWKYLKNGWSKGYKAFYKLSDSLQKTYTFNEAKFNTTLNKPFEDLTPSDLDDLITGFAYLRNEPNHDFYRYIKKHGIKGSKKPTRHEDGDLSMPLALALNIKTLTPMDDQRTNGEYHKAWSQCSKEGQSNGNNTINSKLYKKSYNSSILPALFRGLGKHTNKPKALERLHKSSSFTYVVVKTEGCTLGERYWNERNARMAKNIATQVMANKHTKNIVIVGASHVVGLAKELKEKYPDLQVKLMND